MNKNKKNIDKNFEEVNPFVYEACILLTEIYETVPPHLRKFFAYEFAQSSLSFFIMSCMDGVSIEKNLSNLIKKCVDSAIEKSITMKVGGF